MLRIESTHIVSEKPAIVSSVVLVVSVPMPMSVIVAVARRAEPRASRGDRAVRNHQA